MAAGGFKILSAIKDGEAAHEDWGMVALGTVVSALSAFVVVKWLIRFVQSHTFNGFAWYRILLGGALIMYVSSQAQ
jgi:undecaprenyl-diphosphatase